MPGDVRNESSARRTRRWSEWHSFSMRRRREEGGREEGKRRTP